MKTYLSIISISCPDSISNNVLAVSFVLCLDRSLPQIYWSRSYLVIQLLAQFRPSEPVPRVIHTEYRCPACRPSIYLLLGLLTCDDINTLPVTFSRIGELFC